jgi:hypothetical protein
MKGGHQPGNHSIYYPGEWNHTLCRTHLSNSPLSERRRSYDEICARFSPVFRFFFVERFGHSMQAWHAAKMRYTRSVAVTSIVGHILGIGDRHSSNILVHKGTGEVVHIDFGIVFEQGKVSFAVVIGAPLETSAHEPSPCCSSSTTAVDHSREGTIPFNSEPRGWYGAFGNGGSILSCS